MWDERIGEIRKTVLIPILVVLGFTFPSFSFGGTLDPVSVTSPASNDIAATSVTLTWDQTTTADSDFLCYRVFRSTTSGLSDNAVESVSGFFIVPAIQSVGLILLVLLFTFFAFRRQKVFAAVVLGFSFLLGSFGIPNAGGTDPWISPCVSGDKSTLTYTDTGLDKNTIYYYRVYVFGPDSTYAASTNEIQAVTTPHSSATCTVPTAPDTSSPNQVVGDGTADSCTESAFKTAIASGGIVTFNCGTNPHTITLTSTANINTTVDTTIDGNDLIVLSGGNTTRILEMDTGNFESTTPTLTVMNLTFRDAMSTGSDQFNSNGDYLGFSTDAGGGAIFYHGGNVRVFNSTFINNQCPSTGPDLAGGGVYGIGNGRTTMVNSRFGNNSCSNGGAVGGLHTSVLIYNTTITDNRALGKGANFQDSNNVQQGSGGNGGGILMDGDNQDFLLCGSTVSDNTANALGGGMFRTTYNGTGTMVIDRSTISGNFGTDKDDPNDSNEPSGAGGVYFQGGPITVTDSTITQNSTYGVGGGLQLEFDQTTITFNNVNITENVTRGGLAGGLWIASGITGSISNSSISNNSAPGEVSFAAATAGGGEPGVVLSNTRILNNTSGNHFNPMSCLNPFQDGGGNFQFPVIRPNGLSDDPDHLCSANITIADPG